MQLIQRQPSPLEEQIGALAGLSLSAGGSVGTMRTRVRLVRSQSATMPPRTTVDSLHSQRKAQREKGFLRVHLAELCRVIPGNFVRDEEVVGSNPATPTVLMQVRPYPITSDGALLVSSPQ